jgi:NTE family protein
MTGQGAADTAARRPRVAVVIGSGGLKCLAALGSIRVLREAGVPIDMVVGCSGGSLCAAWLASGHEDADGQASRFVESLQGMFESFDYRAVPRALLPGVFGFGPGFALLDDRKVNAAIIAAVGAAEFSATRIPLRIVATDFMTGDKVVLQHGRLSDAIRASIAIPLVLKPWMIDGRLLTDGGASDPLPVDVAMREGADIIIAMGFEETPQAEIGNLMQLILQVKTITVNQLLRSQLAFYSVSHHAEVIPIIPDLDRRIRLGDVGEIGYLIRQGELAAEREIPYLERLLQLGAASVPTAAVSAAPASASPVSPSPASPSP